MRRVRPRLAGGQRWPPRTDGGGWGSPDSSNNMVGYNNIGSNNISDNSINIHPIRPWRGGYFKVEF